METYTPEAVGGESAKYFMTAVFTIPNDVMNTELSVTPYWTTLDGMEVTGIERTERTGTILSNGQTN